jgi:hypothetical protein
MRHAIHVIASLGMWGLFGYYWYIVLRREINAADLTSMILLLVLIAVGAAATGTWILHNIRLALKFADRRRGGPDLPETTLDHDTLARPVTHPGLAALRQAAVIDIDADAERKVYRVAGSREAP